MSDGIGPRLNAETDRLMATLEQLGVRLRETMKVDINENGTPSRDWCRSLGHYRGGITSLLAEQRERSKLLMLANNKSDQRILSDDEYTAEMRQLAMDSVKQLSDDELEAEIRARGLSIVDVPMERDE